MIGLLIFSIVEIRPNIVFIIFVISRFAKNLFLSISNPLKQSSNILKDQKQRYHL